MLLLLLLLTFFHSEFKRNAFRYIPSQVMDTGYGEIYMNKSRRYTPRDRDIELQKSDV